MADQSCMLVPEAILRYSCTALLALWGALSTLNHFDWRMTLSRFSESCARSKVNVMDTRTLLILGLGIAILLVLGFFALPA
ncbi:hypothetical protein RFN28_05685 [Mesorhizobium sp. VK24D]|uniref:Uncharacterized protein n=1 Tax=Mesorhizobium album TaxID=3072314 RepID=A0ABU4XTD6_9HYPH|nr:hypothetical protein [Mesorhizobium sp. VK24D]MDX8477973.1 hypothetical protein [Mesorhizobium sp. VK24D]